MKHLYLTLLVASASFAASATTLELSQRNTEIAPLMQRSTPASLSTLDAHKAPAMKTPSADLITGEWESLGKGVWFEDLLTVADEFSQAAKGTHWEIEIEHSVDFPGYYRMIPYGDGSFLDTQLGLPDNSTYCYVNATNPDKVYVDGLFQPCYGLFPIQQIVPENGYPEDQAAYGLLQDKVIYFPAGSFAILNYQTGWHVTNNNGNFKIVLPGGDAKDYTFSISSKMCAVDNKVPVTIEAVGDDVTSYKYVLLDDFYDGTASNFNIVAEMGTELSLEYDGLSIAATPGKFCTFIMVAMNAEGKMVNGDAVHFFGIDTDNSDWALIPDTYAVFSEGIFSSVFSDVDSFDYDCDVEQCISNPGRYRLVNPYKNHEIFDPIDHSEHHNHYLYINAEDPECVYFEPSPAGFKVGIYGEAYVWSYGGYFINDPNAGAEALKAEGMVGTFKDGVFSFPNEYQIIGFEGYNNGAILTAGIGTEVRLVNTAGVTDIVAGEEGPAQFFNLQGMPVAKPENGIFIRRSGDKVEKVFVK